MSRCWRLENIFALKAFCCDTGRFRYRRVARCRQGLRSLDEGNPPIWAPLETPLALVSGGETTVTLGKNEMAPMVTKVTMRTWRTEYGIPAISCR